MHIRWIRSLKFEHPAHHILLEENLAAIRDSQDRLSRLEQQIKKLLPGWTLAPVVQAIQAMRGVSEIAAVILVSEIGDFNRFLHPRQLVSYLGLSPSEHSTGSRIVRGPITKAGSEHAPCPNRRRLGVPDACSRQQCADTAAQGPGKGSARHRLEGAG
jgi:transposase